MSKGKPVGVIEEASLERHGDPWNTSGKRRRKKKSKCGIFLIAPSPFDPSLTCGFDLAHYQFRIIIAYETIIIVIINQYKRTKLHVKSFRLSEAERS